MSRLRPVAALSALLLLGAADTPAQIEILSPDGLSPLIARLGAGGRPVVVHFFAMWCDTCHKELPVIREVLRRAQASGAAVVLLSLDAKSDAARILPAFLHDSDLPFDTYLLDAPNPDSVTKLVDARWTGDLPATFVFRNGQRVGSFRAPLKASDALDKVLSGH